MKPGLIFPYDWFDKLDIRAFADQEVKDVCSATSEQFNSTECKRRVVKEEAYSITYWTHSWGDLHTLGLLDAKQVLVE